MSEAVVEQNTMTAAACGIAAQIDAGKLDKAAKALDALEAADGKTADVLYVRGFLQEALFDREAAALSYEAALEIAPEHIEARFSAARLADLLGDDDRAIELYEACCGEERVRINALINLAVLFEEQRKYDSAMWCVDSVQADHPNHARARHFLKSVKSSCEMR